MSIESNKALVRRVFEEIYNQGRYEAADELIATDYLSHQGAGSEIVGAEGVKNSARQQRATFPDLHSFVDDLVAEGDKVVVRFTITGTQLGQWGPLPPTGKPVRFEEIVILRFVDGKVVEQRGLCDNLAALRQLGVVPTPQATSI